MPSTERIDRFIAEKKNEPYGIQLQSVGRVPAIFVSELRVGDHLMWNFGSTTTVKAIHRGSSRFVEVVQVDDETGKEHTRRMKLDRLVAAGQPSETGLTFKFRVITRGKENDV